MFSTLTVKLFLEKLSNNVELGKLIDKAVFPMCQGGPLENTIMAKAVAFKEDLDESFATYMKNVVRNSQKLAKTLMNLGVKVITNGTDNHLLLIDVKSTFGITGLQAQKILEKCHITTNKNSIPNDTEKPMYCSGLRLGTPAMTTRGFNEDDFEEVAKIIFDVLTNKDDMTIQKSIVRIKKLTDKHPLSYEK